MFFVENVRYRLKSEKKRQQQHEIPINFMSFYLNTEANTLSREKNVNKMYLKNGQTIVLDELVSH